MRDVKTTGSYGLTRSLFSNLAGSSIKTRILKIQQVARERALKSEPGTDVPFKARTQSFIRAQNQALLNITDAQSMVTTVEDSLETIVDVLGEMKSLAADAGRIQDGTIFEREDKSRHGSQGWIHGNRGGSEGDMSALRSAYNDRLRELSQEIDEIVRDTDFSGRPLFGDQKSSFTFLVNNSKDDMLEISFDPLGASQLSVSDDDIQVSDNDKAAATLQRIDEATAHVQERLDRLVTVKDRLTIKYENLKMSRRIHEADFEEVGDPGSARKQLELTKLQIAEESNKALLAQANATTSSTLRLIETLYRNDDEGPLARIYSLETERDGAPATHLRRIMLGRSSERPAIANFSEHDA